MSNIENQDSKNESSACRKFIIQNCKAINLYWFFPVRTIICKAKTDESVPSR